MYILQRFCQTNNKTKKQKGGSVLKSTGIVRRIDELGRVVIPKEIRRTFHIREGDLLEIYTGSLEEIIFKKHSVIEQISEVASRYAEILSRSISMPVIITDKETVTAASGTTKKEFLNKKITPFIREMKETRKNITDTENSTVKIHPIEKSDCECLLMFPIIANGDLCGSIIVLKSENAKISNLKNTEKIVKISAEFLGSQLED